MPPQPEADQFSVIGGSGQTLRGESIGQGLDLTLCHGLSATRRYVVHGSMYLPRNGFRLVTYDARGHGESDPAKDGYGYGRMVADLDRVLAETVGSTGGAGPVLGGHSMGCHTVAAWSVANPGRAEALILAGPAWTGEEGQGDADRWDRLAEALGNGGPEAFADAMAAGTRPDSVRARIHRLALDRSRLHRHPEAVAQALREVPRSSPFDSLDLLSRIEVPVLVVATRDEIDPTHPLAVAEMWAEALPDVEFAVEAKGETPLTWQGGRLSRRIEDFLSRHGLGERPR
ncbi:MAG: alpha/beta hydrolase [Solirubrobacterales bacterium]|nr:alpha/beta hydrolase [Solirubrobacterales bacterium]